MPEFASHVVRGLYRLLDGPEELARRIDEICAEVSAAIADGARIIILSDRHSNIDFAPIPSRSERTTSSCQARENRRRVP